MPQSSAALVLGLLCGAIGLGQIAATEAKARKNGQHHLGYTSVLELLGEKFHVSEALLKRLNPGVDFGRAGQEFVVPNTARKKSTQVSRIEVDGSRQEVRALAGDGRLIAIFPATVGGRNGPRHWASSVSR